MTIAYSDEVVSITDLKTAQERLALPYRYNSVARKISLEQVRHISMFLHKQASV